MKSLFLMRHAKSSWDDANQKDFDRVINERGKKDAPEMGKRLRRSGCMPDLIISSPALRALKTAKEVARELGYADKEIASEFTIYEADIDALIHVIRSIDDKYKHVMLVGHNPSITGIVGYLTNQFIDNMPTSGVVQVNFDLSTWKQVTKNTGKFVTFDFPKNQAS